MTDAGRKSFADQAADKLKPDSQKSTTEKLGDNVSQKYDHAASAIQPDSQKSTTQKAGDSLRGNTDDAKDESKGIAAQVSDSVSSGIQNAKEAVTGNKQ